MDGLVVSETFSSVVAKQEIANWPIVGSMSTLIQSVFVTRHAANSKKNQKNVHDLIKNRAEEPSWPQLLLFPEGTVTNAKALINFKVGAFKPLLPVQPVLIHRKSRSYFDTFTKTWNQKHGYMGCLWLTLCQFSTDFEFEFLPVYQPSGEETENPMVYAQNVRALMAEKLGIPMVDRSVSEFIQKTSNKN